MDLRLSTTLRSQIDGGGLNKRKGESEKFIKFNKRGGRNRRGVGFLLFFDQNLVICYKICLQTCFTNFWKGKLLKIRKQSFHMQNKFSLLFLEILTNTNTNKCCQMFLTFLKRFQKCFLLKKYSLLDSCQQQLVVVPALFERSPHIKLQTLNRLNGGRHLSSLVQRTAP